MVSEDGGSCFRVRGKQQHHSIEASGTTQGRVDVPGLIGGADHEDAIVRGLDSIEFDQQLCNHVAKSAPSQVHPRMPDGVQLVKEKDAWRIAACLLEQLVKELLGVSEPHVERLVQADIDESSIQLPGNSAGKKRLAASWWTPQEESTAQVRPVCASELWVAQRRKKRLFQSLLHIFETTDVCQSDRCKATRLANHFFEKTVPIDAFGVRVFHAGGGAPHRVLGDPAERVFLRGITGSVVWICGESGEGDVETLPTRGPWIANGTARPSGQTKCISMIRRSTEYQFEVLERIGMSIGFDEQPGQVDT